MALTSSAASLSCVDAPGTKLTTDADAMGAMGANTIFPNTALTADGDVWQEELTPLAREGA